MKCQKIQRPNIDTEAMSVLSASEQMHKSENNKYFTNTSL